MEFEVGFAELDRKSGGRGIFDFRFSIFDLLAGEGVAEGLVEVEFGDGVAELVFFGAFEAVGAGAGIDGGMALAAATGQVREDFHELRGAA